MRERPKTVNPRNSANRAKSPDSAQGITLRPVVLAADQDFLLQVYASTRAHEMSLVPWTDAQKQAFVRQQFEAQLAHYAMQYPEASRIATISYVVVWFVVAGANMWVGVSKAGYSVADELPIFLLIFGVPAALALVLRWQFP